METFAWFEVEDRSVFPKICRSCNKQYGSFEEYVSQTTDVNGSGGLAEYPEDDKSSKVGVFRNCECGSTLLVVCFCRRDESEEGEMRRRNFDHMLDRYQSKGISREQARCELRNVMRGGKSHILESAGLRLS